ncbi:MAG: hypothetical protein ACFFC7_29220 [Candidatus Hermodarchaeota archaeon]
MSLTTGSTRQKNISELENGDKRIGELEVKSQKEKGKNLWIGELEIGDWPDFYKCSVKSFDAIIC